MKVYFASDLHLTYNDAASRQRERLFVQWLDMVKHDASEIYLLGDMLDFWFEYRKAAPRGFSRFFGKLCELTDNGIPVHYFTGNHDLWINDYLPVETGVAIHNKPLKTEINGVRFMIGHGHGLGDSRYNRLISVYSNKILRMLYSAIHPRWGMAFGQWCSAKSRNKNQHAFFESVEKEKLVQYAKRKLSNEHVDYFIFGHRHIPMHIKISEGSYYVNTGEWINRCTYAVFENKEVTLKTFGQKDKAIFMITNRPSQSQKILTY